MEETPIAVASPEALRVVKDGKVLILVDLRPKWDQLRKLAALRQAEYLKRSAVHEGLNLPADRPEFAGKDAVTVRMVLLQGRDEYNRPKWGTAEELGLFELSRSALRGLTPETVNQLPEPDLDRLFTSMRLKQGALP